jgi:hypothetical protein
MRMCKWVFNLILAFIFDRMVIIINKIDFLETFAKKVIILKPHFFKKQVFRIFYLLFIRIQRM